MTTAATNEDRSDPRCPALGGAPAQPNPTARSRVCAYLVNRYPAPSHSFIRREILALEQLGCRVLRFSIRRGEVTAGHDADAAELANTHVLLAGNKLAMVLRGAWTMVCRPRRTWRALRRAVRMGWRSDRGVLRHLAYLIEAAALLRAVHGKADQLHAHFGTNSAMVALLCFDLGGPPYSFTVHGPEEFERCAGIGLPEKVANAAFVVAISDFGRSQLWRFVPVEQWPKVVVVRCGVDAMFLQPAPLAIPAAPELLWVGRMAPEKGIPVLLRACRLLREQRVAFRLTLVGGGPLEAWVGAEIADAGLAEHVALMGWRNAEQIREHMDRSRGLVVASFAEGLPVVIMEALARGRPVVATRIAAIPELVVPGETGWLVGAGRADQLAEAMRELLQAPVAELERLGACGRQRIEAAHDAGKEAEVLRRTMSTVRTGP